MYRKPLLGTYLNKSHPLAHNLIGCWIMNERSGLRVLDYSGFDRHGVVSGVKWIDNGLLSNANYDNVTIDITLTGINTIVLGFRCMGNVPGGGYRYAFMGQVATMFNLIQYSNNIWYYAINNSVKASADAYPLTIGRYYQIAASFPGYHLWLNENKIISEGTRVPTITTMYMGANPGTATRYINSVMNYCYIYTGLLTEYKISRLLRTPYAMFERQKFRFFPSEVGMRIPVIMQQMNQFDGGGAIL